MSEKYAILVRDRDPIVKLDARSWAILVLQKEIAALRY